MAPTKVTGKTILVYDKVWNGHIPTYHKIICETLLQQGWRVISASPVPHDVYNYFDTQHPQGLLITDITLTPYNGEYTAEQANNANAPASPKLAAHPKGFKQLVIDMLTKRPFIKKFFSVIEQWKMLDALIKAKLPGVNPFVFIPYLDKHWVHPLITCKLIQSKFSFRWSGIYLHTQLFRKYPFFNYTNPFSTFNIFKAQNCTGLYILEENVQPIIERLAKNNIWLFPDIANVDYKDTYTDPILQQIKQLSRTHTVILLAGVLNERKNVFTFLQAAKIARQKKLPWIFVVAGYTNKYFWDKEENYNRFMLELNAGHSNLFSKTDGIADGTPFNSYIANCHIMFAAYHKFYYSSNIITKIAHFHKPVVVTQNCLMALRVHKYQLGKAIDDASANELVDAISSLDGYSQNANFIDGCNRYYSLHTIQKLQQALMHITKQ